MKENDHWIEAKLELLDFVEWDRFTEYDHPERGRVVDVYGWIGREDEYKDFLTVTFDPDVQQIHTFTTSSDEYTEEITRLLYGEVNPDTHVPCKRVEDRYDVDNCVKLQTTLGDS